jgi:hypothetical protein
LKGYLDTRYMRIFMLFVVGFFSKTCIFFVGTYYVAMAVSSALGATGRGR